MQVVDGDDGDIIDAAGQDSVAVFQIARQVVERAGRRESTRNGKEHDLLAGKQLVGGDFDRAIGGLFLEGGGRQLVSDGNGHGLTP